MLKFIINSIIAFAVFTFFANNLESKEVTNNKMVVTKINGEKYKMETKDGKIFVQTDFYHSPNFITLNVQNGIIITSNDSGKTWKVEKESDKIGTKVENLNDSKQIFPLPSNGELNINFENKKLSNAQVLNLEGKIIFEQKGDNIIKLDLTSLSNGSYILVLTLGNIKYSEMISIIK